MGVHLHLPHLGHEKKKEGGAVGVPTKGCMTIKVGQEGEEKQRFVVPVMYLNHPLFMGLLKVAEEEYGFEQQGAITIPCHVEHFRYVQGIIDRDNAAGSGGHHHHNGHHFHLAGCFKA
ncbi:auxin-responsive protein SAUR32 [Cocos nucifera]|uniref:Auxin-responsive protein SAUR32 n=1 Tax=Cocos nucifera TaxID=13894 RepID=A0A8K0IJI8_COCNU|nr:auxin-responsive protein SAUR32 [Cocos nucifera]